MARSHLLANGACLEPIEGEAAFRSARGRGLVAPLSAASPLGPLPPAAADDDVFADDEATPSRPLGAGVAGGAGRSGGSGGSGGGFVGRRASGGRGGRSDPPTRARALWSSLMKSQSGSNADDDDDDDASDFEGRASDGAASGGEGDYRLQPSWAPQSWTTRGRAAHTAGEGHGGRSRGGGDGDSSVAAWESIRQRGHGDPMGGAASGGCSGVVAASGWCELTPFTTSSASGAGNGGADVGACDGGAGGGDGDGSAGGGASAPGASEQWRRMRAETGAC